MLQSRFQSRTLHAFILLLAFCVFARAATIEPVIVPTVHATLSPTSAIQSPLKFYADETAVWRSDMEQRVLLTGRVSVSIGYRLLNADAAAIWLSPSRESGSAVWDVAIYLSGNVKIREGNLKNATTTVGRELLVTTRVTQSVQLASNPVSKSEEESPIFKRGLAMRQDLLNRPLAQLHVPTIVITDNERALQSGWIARGPNNRIIPGPGDLQIVRDAQGNIIPGGSLPQGVKALKPRPSAFVTSDNPHRVVMDKEIVVIAPGAYLLYDSHDGKPPLEFRAQNMVLFSPNPAAATQPATSTAPATQPATPTPLTTDITQSVTGVYLEGDVTLDQGDQVMVRAERIYYDFTTQRAIMLDATLATVDEKRDLPIYMRAHDIRQLQRGEFAAHKVTFSTSEFYTPHYHIGASEVYLRDVTPQIETPTGEPGNPLDFGMGGDLSAKTYQFTVKDATINALGVPIFYYPFLAGDTSQTELPLKAIRISHSKAYGLSLLTDWNLFSLLGQTPPEGFKADLNLDYYGSRGPAAGVNAEWKTDDDHGLARLYALYDHGTDQLGDDREDIEPLEKGRGRATLRDQRDLGNGLTLQLEASYISDPTFMEQFFQKEFNTDKEQETSIYLKKQGETDALTFLGKFNLMDFTATADAFDSQTFTEKKPELKYWRIGDNFFDLLTYFSETSFSNVHSNITNFTPQQLGIRSTFIGFPGNQVLNYPASPNYPPPGNPNMTFRDYYRSQGWTTNDVLRADTRQEIDLPLHLGDINVTPYATGRITFWDQDFPDNPPAGGADGGSTVRYWGGAGLRASTQIWKVYEDVNSTFFDVHRLRHIIEPQFNMFYGVSNVDRGTLQPFDRDVEGITGSSMTQVAINQKWQTKRGGEGHWRDVDWITFNVAWNQFYNKDDPKKGIFLAQLPARGFYFPSRPELSLASSSINVDGTWRIGEHVRLQGEANYSLDAHRLSQYAWGIAIDQSPTLSYFLGNRYVTGIPSYDQGLSAPATMGGSLPTATPNLSFLTANDLTAAIDYQLTKKYEMIFTESYDFGTQNGNILTSMTIIRKLPRLNVAITITYDANQNDTSISFTAWPEGLEDTSSQRQTGAHFYNR